MEMIDVVKDVILSIGFPIVMCLLVFWRMGQESDAHHEEVASLRDVIAENTKALAQLQQLIEDKI